MAQQDDVARLRERVGELEQQLEAVQAELQIATNRDITLLKGTVRGMLHGEIETIDEFPVAGRAFGQRVGRLRH